uniref:ANK_REP_REGION domain-containing protein n=1 Tax=Angiostrongylus cantonensis TaxID=6313 RepID=A0A158PAJ4_ANGCA
MYSYSIRFRPKLLVTLFYNITIFEIIVGPMGSFKPLTNNPPIVGEPDHQCEDAVRAARLEHPACLSRLSNEQILIRDELGETVMHRVIRERDYNSAKLLLQKAPVLREMTSLVGETPAHIAIAMGEQQIVELLLCGQLKKTLKAALTRDINGTSILTASVIHGNNVIALWLLRTFGKKLAMLPNNFQMIPLHVAAAQGNIEFVKLATKWFPKSVDARDAFGCTPSAYAVQGGCLSTLEYLVEKAHAAIGCVNRRGQSLLHIASLCGYDKIVRWILNRVDAYMILWRTVDNANAIHCAAFCGSVPILRLLLLPWSRKKRQSVLRLRDGRGNTALHLAANNGHFDAVSYLIMSNADPTDVNAAGLSAQAIATIKGNRQMAAFIAGFRELFRSEHAEVIRRRMRFIEDDQNSLRDSSVQTVEDDLVDHVKILSDEAWTGMGLSAVEHIDRVLDEAEHLEG